MLAIGLIAALPISFISINALINSSQAQAKEFGQRSAHYNSEIIGTWIAEKSEVLIALKHQIENLNNETEIIDLMRMYSDSNKDFISIFIGMENNVMLDAYNWQPDANYQVAERPWYKSAIDTQSYVTTSVYSDANKKRNVTAVATSIEILGKKGVLAANIYVDYIVDIIDDIKYGDNGFAVLVDPNNNIITQIESDDKAVIFQKIINSVNFPNMSQEQSNVTEITINNVEYIVAYSNVKNINWKLILVSPMSDFIKSAKLIQNQLIYILFATIILIIILDYHFSRTISKPIEELVSAVSGIARGNFDTPISIRSHDEIGSLSKELEKMRQNLKKIFNSLQYESKIVSMNSKNLTEHLNETYQGTTRFMLMLSHDIKTPITLIKGYSKALSSNMIDPEKTREYIEKIQYRSEQIENILTDTLDNTYEVSDIKVNLKEINMADYINMILYNSENYVTNQAHSFTRDIDASLYEDRRLLAIDLTKIQRVVNNILSNAVKFSEAGSQIKLIMRQKGDRILTCFQDFGSGIAEEDKEKVFNMFYKTNSDKKGYGLGLYINKAIIEAHGGEIYFKSILNKGTISGYYLNIEAHEGEERID